jgi:hypothetical protein
MKTYVRRGLDLVLKSTDSSGGIPGNLSVQLTGVVNSPEILPNSSGKILIPTNQIYSTRGLRGVVALTNNSAGNYKLAAFNCRDACAVTIDVKCGGIVNYR